MGFIIGPTGSPITPIILGNETVTQQFAKELYEAGVFVNAVTRPAVRRGEARLRLTVRADHSSKQIQTSLGIIRQVGKKLGLIAAP